MSYHIERFFFEPIIIAAVYTDFSLADDWEAFISELIALLDAQSEPVFFITDLRVAPIDLGDLISGNNLATRGSRAGLNHPNVCEHIIVTTTKVLEELAAVGPGAVAVGHIPIMFFDSLKDAVAHCRAHARFSETLLSSTAGN